MKQLAVKNYHDLTSWTQHLKNLKDSSSDLDDETLKLLEIFLRRWLNFHSKDPKNSDLDTVTHVLCRELLSDIRSICVSHSEAAGGFPPSSGAEPTPFGSGPDSSDAGPAPFGTGFTPSGSGSTPLDTTSRFERTPTHSSRVTFNPSTPPPQTSTLTLSSTPPPDQPSEDLLAGPIRAVSSSDALRLKTYLLGSRGCLFLYVLHHLVRLGCSPQRQVLELLVSLIPVMTSAADEEAGGNGETAAAAEGAAAEGADAEGAAAAATLETAAGAAAKIEKTPSVESCFRSTLEEKLGIEKKEEVRLDQDLLNAVVKHAIEINDRDSNDGSKMIDGRRRRLRRRRRTRLPNEMDDTSSYGDSDAAAEAAEREGNRYRFWKTFFHVKDEDEKEAEEDMEVDEEVDEEVESIFQGKAKIVRPSNTKPLRSTPLDFVMSVLNLLVDAVIFESEQTTSPKSNKTKPGAGAANSKPPPPLSLHILKPLLLAFEELSYIVRRPPDPTAACPTGRLLAVTYMERTLFKIVGVIVRRLGPQSLPHVSLTNISLLNLFSYPIRSSFVFVVSDVLQGVFWGIQKLLESLPLNPTFISSAMGLVHDYNAWKGPHIFSQVMQVSSQILSGEQECLMDVVYIERSIKATIKAISTLMTSCKKTKNAYIHAVKCLKRRHNQLCSTSEYLNHHHNILSFQESGLRKDSAVFSVHEALPSFSFKKESCVISLLSQNVLDSLATCQSRSLCHNLLTGLEIGGVCCCMEPEFVLKCLLSKLQRFDSTFIDFTLNVMKKLLIEQLGLSARPSANSLYLCPQCQSDQSDLAFLGYYRQLLIMSNDHALTDKLCLHILSIVEQGTINVRETMFIQVIHPMLKVVPWQKLAEPDSDTDFHSHAKNPIVMSEAIFEGCLKSLPLLLVSQVAKQTFVGENGLNFIIKLMGYGKYIDYAMLLLESIINTGGVVSSDTEFTSDQDLQAEEALSLVDDTSDDSFQPKSELPQSNLKSELDLLLVLLLNTKLTNMEDLIQENIYKEVFEVVGKREKYFTDLKTMKALWLLCLKLFATNKQFKNKFKSLKEYGNHVELQLIHLLNLLCVSSPIYSHLESSSKWADVMTLFEILLTLFCETRSNDSLSLDALFVMITSNLNLLDSVIFKILFRVINASYGINNVLTLSTVKNRYREEILAKSVISEAEVWEEESNPSVSITDDKGYDADTEAVNEVSSLDDDVVRLTPITMKPNIIVELPELMILAIKVTIFIISAQNESLIDDQVLECVKLLSRVHEAMKLSDQNKLKLFEFNVASLLLDGFQEILISSSFSTLSSRTLTTLQRIVITLTQEVMKSGLSKENLTSLIRLLSKNPSTSLCDLLTCFLEIITAHPHKPSCVLEFPVISKPTTSLETSINKLILNDKEEDSTSSHSSNESPLSPSNRAVVKIGLKETPMSWPLKNKASFAIIFWMCLLRKTKTQKNDNHNAQRGSMSSTLSSVSLNPSEEHVRQSLHIISIGTSQYQLEIWVHEKTNAILLRLTCYGIMIAESAVSVLKTGVWQSIGINYTHEIENDKTLVNLSLFIDGMIQRDLPFVFRLQTIRELESTYSSNVPQKSLFGFFQRASKLGLVEGKPNADDDENEMTSMLKTVPRILLGDCIQEGFFPVLEERGQIHFTSLYLMKEAVLTREIAYRFHRSGPSLSNFHSINSPQSRNKNLSLFMTEDLISSVSSIEEYDILSGHVLGNMGYCEQMLVLSYNAKNPNVCYTFVSNTKLKNNLCPSQNPLIQPVINKVEPSVFAKKQFTIEHILIENGGISPFLYLFGKVIELTNHDYCQSKALSLFLQISNHSLALNEEFQNLGGYKLLCLVLSNRKCQITNDMVTSLEKICAQNVYVGKRCARFIREPLIITEIIFNWRVWEACPDLWSSTLEFIDSLISQENLYMEFNIRQLEHAKIVSLLLTVVLEIFQETKDKELLTTEASNKILSIIQKMTGAPPSLNNLDLIVDFLLLIHPPPCTYVAHANSSFYFSYRFSEIPDRFLKESTVNDGSGAPSETRSSSAPQPSDLTEASRQQMASSMPNLDAISPNNTSGSANQNMTVVPPDNGVDWELVTHSMKTISLKVTKAKVSEKTNSVTEGLEIICSGLLNLLNGVIVNLPDGLRDQVIGKIIKMETLLVLAHHSSAKIRAAVVKLLSGFIYRLPGESSDIITKDNHLILLTTQLHQYPANRCLIEACLEMITSRPFSLDENFWFEAEDNSVQTGVKSEQTKPKFTQVRKQAVVTILGLLEQTVHDPVLMHNTLIIVYQIFDSSSALAAHLMQYGLVESLCNTFNSLMEFGYRIQNKKHLKKVIIDIIHLFCLIAQKLLCTSGVKFFQRYEEAVTLLQFLEKRLFTMEPTGGVRVAVRMTLDGIFQTSLKYFEVMGVEFVGATPAQRNTINSLPMSVLEALYPILTEPSREVNETSAQEDNTNNASTSQMAKDALKSMEIDSGMNPLTETKPKVIRELSINRPICENSEDHKFRFKVFLSGPGDTDLNLGERGTNSEPSSHLRQMFLPSGSPVVTSTELIDRFKKVITLSVNHILSGIRYFKTQSCIVHLPHEQQYFHDMVLSLLFKGLCSTLMIETDRGQAPGSEGLWKNMLWISRDVMRQEITRLLAGMLEDIMPLASRISVISFLFESSSLSLMERTLISCMSTSFPLACKIVSEVMLMLMNERSSLSNNVAANCMHLIEIFHRHNICFLAPEVFADEKETLRASIEADRLRWVALDAKDDEVFLERNGKILQKLQKRWEALSKSLSARAMEITQRVNEHQCAERKKFLELLKISSSNTIQVQRDWRSLIEKMSHERAIWFDEASYPINGFLDPTEGPGCERRRFLRRHAKIDARFFRGMGPPSESAPLAYLFDAAVDFDSSEITKFRLHLNKKIDFTIRCQNVLPGVEKPGEILIGENVVYFVGNDPEGNDPEGQERLNLMPEPSEGVLVSWLGEDISEIHTRWYSLEDRALEVFLVNGRAFLLALDSPRDRDSLLAAIHKMALPNYRESDTSVVELQSLWVERKITNFEYLVQLNKIAGRTTNDLMQYPIFPFVLSDYSSATLDLTNPSVFRDLSKPIAVQNKSKVARYVQNYLYLKEERDRIPSTGGGGGRVSEEPTIPKFLLEPYHYGSHYSNSGTVLHYLVRVLPFTSLFLKFQDGNFDIPDRTFHSMETSWRLSSEESTTDVKELIPEFFYLPEMFMNLESLEFGRRQSGEIVDHVALPPWAAGDPRIFTLVHRQALESEVVTANLPAWIDLIFGFKQRGKPAVDAVNVFHPATYCGLNADDLGEEVQRRALLTMIRTYGQTPKQLFKAPHPRADMVVDASRMDVVRSPGATPTGDGVQTVNAVSTCGGQMFIIAGDKEDNDFNLDDNPCPLSDPPSILNFHWGSFVGSPRLAAPVCTWRQRYDAPGVSSMVALPSGEVFGLGAATCLLAMFSVKRFARDVFWAAIISWGHDDGVLRIKNQKDKPALNFLYPQYGWTWPHKVTACASASDCRLLFVGSSSGIITVYSMTFDNERQSHVEVAAAATNLIGHKKAITLLQVSSEWSVVVSASADASVIVWDVNRLDFLSSFADHEEGVRCLALSKTTGDIATVSWKEEDSMKKRKTESLLWLHTINGRKIAKHRVRDRINFLTFSNSPEGISVNVIAGGLESGLVRLWSSWDLRPLRDICTDNSHNSLSPVISLIFTPGAKRLYVSRRDGQVSIWETPPIRHLKPPNFVPYLCPT